ncbi:MAG: NIPSNAP family protein [Deltaproteobacteria bacterium]|nr:NIPSNAP family protein [Deltaproteobacteria bacterium]
MDSRIILVASLFIHPGHEAEFRQFETEAARIMRKYGGRIERVIRPHASVPLGSSPHEIHIVSFPSMAQFEAYRKDGDLAKCTPLRQSAIARTEIIIGEEGEPYF